MSCEEVRGCPFGVAAQDRHRPVQTRERSMHDPWVLITGNGAFGDTAERIGLRYSVNPSGLLAAQLDGEVIAGRRVVGRGLQWNEHPAEALLPMLEAAHKSPPEIVISTGVFSGRATITVEKSPPMSRIFSLPTAPAIDLRAIR